MGGYGSGRTGRRPVAETSLAFRIGSMREALRGVVQHQHGHVRASGSMVWKRGYLDHVVASIGYSVTGDRGRLVVTLHYRANGQRIDDVIQIRAQPCHFGGVRYWWVCPGCGRLVGVLYAPGLYWRCRSCWRVTYQSSNDSDRRVTRLMHNLSLYGDFLDHARLGMMGASDLIITYKALTKLRQMHARNVRRALKESKGGSP